MFMQIQIETEKSRSKVATFEGVFFNFSWAKKMCIGLLLSLVERCEGDQNFTISLYDCTTVRWNKLDGIMNSLIHTYTCKPFY